MACDVLYTGVFHECGGRFEAYGFDVCEEVNHLFGYVKREEGMGVDRLVDIDSKNMLGEYALSSSSF